MMGIFKTAVLGFALLVVPILAVQSVHAQFNPLDPSCLDENGNRRPELADSDLCAESELREDENPLTGTEGVIMTVANVLALISGVIAVIIIIISGIQMITSSGDSNKVKSARDTIIYASVGIVVIVLARSIVIFIINAVG